MRISRGTALAVALVLGGMLLSTSAAHGEPVTDDDVAAARAAVSSATAAVAAIELELAAQSAAVDDAWQAVAVAAEDYTEALVAQGEADGLAARAAERSAAAAAELEEARDELGRIALAAHRSGGSLDEVAVLLSADDMADYVERSTAIERLGTRADRAVQRFEAAELVAEMFAARADDALLAAAEAAEAAEAALQVAKALQATAESEAARIAAERETLIAQLAELRQTSVEVERARQAAIEADRAARARAAAGAGSPAAPASPPPANPTVPPGTAPPPSSPPTSPPSSPPAGSDPDGLGTGSQRGSAAQGEVAVDWALAQVGKPYAFGGSGPDSFDCSGLTMRAWQAAGLAINRTSRDQYRQVHKVTYESMRPGDLVFWGTNPADPGSIYHVAMFVGGGQMVEAPSAGNPVRVTSIRWGNTMPYAGRP
jgi:cell wall-associated NlpC family hydrolase